MDLKSTPPQEEFRFGNCVLRSDTRELLRDGEVQKIERRSFDLLRYLLEQEGRVVGKDELLENVWRKRHVTDAVIAQSIMKVRKALGIRGREEGPIRTVHSVGYRFVGELRREARPSPVESVDATGAVPAVQWLPTEADASVTGLPWMRKGLMTLVAHLLRSNGVELHHDAGGDALARAATGRLGPLPMAVVHTRMRQVEGRYELCWRLQWDADEHQGRAEGCSPVEPFLRSAIEVALLVRLHALSVRGFETNAAPWRDLLSLLQFRDDDDTRDDAAPREALMTPLPSDATAS